MYSSNHTLHVKSREYSFARLEGHNTTPFHLTSSKICGPRSPSNLHSTKDSIRDFTMSVQGDWDCSGHSTQIPANDWAFKRLLTCTMRVFHQRRCSTASQHPDMPYSKSRKLEQRNQSHPSPVRGHTTRAPRPYDPPSPGPPLTMSYLRSRY